jgi:hypothetical protein
MRAHSQRRRLRVLAATWVGFVALLAAIAAGSAQASPPMKLAERRCVNEGGTFVAEPNRYSCSGMDSSKTFSFMDSANRHCLNGFKGVEFDRFGDPATGEWSYTCILSF